MKRACCVAALAGLLLGSATACPLPLPALRQGNVQATWKVEGAAMPLGKMFAVQVQVCPANAVLTRVNATMPEHQHGMNYRPSIERIGDAKDGRWRADGLMFHMPGRWELRFDIQADGRTVRLTDSVQLP